MDSNPAQSHIPSTAHSFCTQFYILQIYSFYLPQFLIFLQSTCEGRALFHSELPLVLTFVGKRMFVRFIVIVEPHVFGLMIANK
jgi:hypothetical protein